MNPIEDGVIVDACTLKNFSVVDRMDVLGAYFSGRARWTDATVTCTVQEHRVDHDDSAVTPAKTR